jgi:hypothetical protein
MVHAFQVSIYVLCLLTATACFLLLLKGFFRSGTRLLLWSGVCFCFLALHSLVVVIELMVVPHTDLQILRHAASLLAAASLVFGLIWEAE